MKNTYNVTLPAHLNDVARLQIDRGLYSSFNELVRDALRRLLSVQPVSYSQDSFTKQQEELILKSSKANSDDYKVLPKNKKLSKFLNELDKKGIAE